MKAKWSIIWRDRLFEKQCVFGVDARLRSNFLISLARQKVSQILKKSLNKWRYLLLFTIICLFTPSDSIHSTCSVCPVSIYVGVGLFRSFLLVEISPLSRCDIRWSSMVSMFLHHSFSDYFVKYVRFCFNFATFHYIHITAWIVAQQTNTFSVLCKTFDKKPSISEENLVSRLEIVSSSNQAHFPRKELITWPEEGTKILLNNGQ